MDQNLLDPNSQNHHSRDEDFEGIDDAQTVYEGSREEANKSKSIGLLPILLKGAPQDL